MNLRKFIYIASFLVSMNYSTAFAQSELALRNPGFEEGNKWWALVDEGISEVVPDAAHGDGANGLRITDESDNAGASVFSQLMPAKPGATYTLSFWGRYLRGNGIAVSLVFYDSDKKIVGDPLEQSKSSVTLAEGTTEWTQFSVNGVAPANAETLRIWIHSFYAAKPIGDVDDFELIVK